MTRIFPHLILLLAMTSWSGARAIAQDQPSDSLVATLRVDSSRYLDARTPIEVIVSRPLTTGESLALIVGNTDVTALAEHRPTGLTYHPRVIPLPSGEQAVTVYLREGDEWRSLHTVTIKVLLPGGFQRLSGTGGATLGNTGQLARGVDGATPEGRATWQDFSLTTEAGVQLERPGLTTELAATAVGSSRQEDALRYAIRASEAPHFDLSSYRVTVASPSTRLALGHVTFGESRHLLNGFGARGVTGAWSRGGTTVRVGSLGGAATVGWDQLLPIGNTNHRVVAASLRREVVPKRPGALRVDATWADASVLPRTAFTQGGVVDAEASSGGSLQVDAASPGDRLRLSGGVTRSRFINPPLDPQLGSDTLLVEAEEEVRTARFLELHLVPLRERALPRLGAASASLVVRHERVDPLYRSAITPVQADRRQEGVEGTLVLGALSVQATLGRSRDNLAGIPTLMTTRDRHHATGVALPLARLVRATRHAAWFPVASWNTTRTHQRGDGVPDGNVFTPDQVPDQISNNDERLLQWNARAWRVSVRRNRADQDNRQVGRAAADFGSGSDAIGVGRGLGSAGDVSLDLGDDFQESRERGERTRTRRGTLNVNLRRGQSTSAVLAWSLLRTRPSTGPVTRNTEERLEVTQPLLFLRGAEGAARGQVFLRLSRSSALQPDFGLADNPLATRRERRWALASGLNLRLF